MDTLVTTLAKNLSAWGRKATVQAADSLSDVGSVVWDGANLWLGKARVVLGDTASVTWQAIQTKFRS